MVASAEKMTPRKDFRLNFRFIGLDDIKLCYAWGQNAEVVRYLPSMPKPLDWEKHKLWALRVMQHADREDFMIDMVDLIPLNFGGGVPFPVANAVGRVHAVGLTTPNPEVGVLIGDTSVWGRGVATEAIGWMVQWLHDHGPWTQCHALIHPENIASIRAFEKNGFSQREKVRGRGDQWIFDKVIRES